MKYRLLIYSLNMLIILLLFASCDSSTKPKYAELSGVVSLVNDTNNPNNDPVDFSGVSIALYALATPDSTLNRIHIEYPGIGCEINQKVLFDHRFETPLLSVTTESNGVFNIERISPGVYNLVISKAGWGWRYIYSVLIGKAGDQTKIDIQLYPETQVSSYHGSLFLMKENHHYLLTDTAYFEELEMQSGAWIRMKKYADLHVINSIISPQVNYGFVVQEIDEDLRTSSISLPNATQDDISHLVFRDLYNALSKSGGQISISDCAFINCSSMINVTQAVLDVHKSLYIDRHGIGLSLACDGTEVDISENIIISGLTGVLLRTYSLGVIENNYIHAPTALRLDAGSTTLVQNNCLESSNKCLLVKQADLVSIKNNKMYGYDGVYLESISLTANHVITGNNLYSQNLYLNASLQMNPAYAAMIFNAGNNYFHRESLDLILQHIKDANDYDVAERWVLTFNIDPIATTPFANAGILTGQKK